SRCLTSFTADLPGTFVVQLIVNDGTVNSAPDTAMITVAAPPQADIQVTKAVNDSSPVAGTDVTFTVGATNAGPSDAPGVTAADPLPGGYTFISATSNVGSYTSGTGVWSVGALANGATATLSITATVLAVGPYINTATVTASSPTDPNTANNSASVIVAVCT